MSRNISARFHEARAAHHPDEVSRFRFCYAGGSLSQRLVRILRRKQAKRPAQAPAVKPSRENVVNFMDALRRSVAADHPAKPTRRCGAAKPATERRGGRHRRAG
jgi:hypothetical protein